jgi:hypothetical protein
MSKEYFFDEFGELDLFESLFVPALFFAPSILVLLIFLWWK